MMNNHLSVFLFDDIQVEPQTFRVYKADLPVQLEPKTLKLLIFLIENRGRLIEKGEILDAIWKDVVVTENALTREVAKLRKSLGDDPKAAKYISTVHTRGYRFIAEVEVKISNGHKSDQRSESQLITAAQSQNGSATKTAQPAELHALSSSRHLRKGKWLLAVAMLFVVVTACLIALNYYFEPDAAVAPTVLEITPITAAPELDLNPTFSPDGNSLAYSSDRNGSVEIYVRPIASGGREIQLTADGNQNMEPAWSPEGDFIAFHSAKRGGIWLIPALGGTAKQLTEFGCRPTWLRDGSMIAFQSESFHDMIQPYISAATIWVIPSQGGTPRQVTQAGSPAGGHLFPSWSSDGKRIAFLNADMRSMQIWSVSIAGDQLKRLTTEETGDKADVIYSPDNESIFFTAGMMLIKQRLSPDTGDPVGRPVKVADLGATLFRHPTFSADGSKVAYSAWTVKSNVWSVPISPRAHEATGPAVALTNELNSRNGLTAFSPDGKKIAFTSMRRGIGYQLWLMDSDGKNQTPLTTDSEAAYSPAWYPSGSQIGFYCMRRGRSTLSALMLDSRKERVLVEAEGLEMLRLSPDAKQVAFTYAPDNLFNIGIMDVEDGQQRQLTFEQTIAGLPCWSPDGKSLAFQTRRGDDMQIMLMPSSGGTPTQLTFEHGDSWPYSWSPGGDKIAFAGSRNGVWNVWWISLSDKTEKQVTNNTNAGVIIRFPDWSPTGSQIVYEQAEITSNIYIMSLK